MFVQLALGSAVILCSILIGGVGFLSLETAMTRYRAWFASPPHTPKLLLLLCGAVLWFLLLVTASVWLWAVVFLWLGIFDTLEAAVYFAMVAFTTLGFGDVLLPEDWRLLSGLASVNGLMMIGLQVTILVEVLRLVRAVQAKERRET